MTKEDFKKVYMVGIKGAGMAALAVLLKKKHMIVSGCDVSDSFFTDEMLRRSAIPVNEFSGLLPDDITAVIYSTAWESRDEVVRAREKNIPTFTYPQAVAALFNDAFGIAVCGSHGKTTTSAMLAWIFWVLGKEPSAIVGSEMRQLGTNALAGSSDFFILEADEYQNKLELYHPHAIIMTNVDYDHPDFFVNPNDYDVVFRVFASTCTGPIVACWDDVGIRRIFKQSSMSAVYYGTDVRTCTYAFTDYVVHDGCAEIKIWKQEVYIGALTLDGAGTHLALNALGAFAMADTLGIAKPEEIINALWEFQGTRRRFEYKGVCGTMRVIDDYAHHPAEIQATLKAAREIFPGKKIWCVFGPHTFTRTMTLLDDFANSFRDCDHALLLDIYGSARETCGGVHSSDLVERIQHVSGNAEYVGTHENAIRCILESQSNIDILITMGASDVNLIGERIVAECQTHI